MAPDEHVVLEPSDHVRWAQLAEGMAAQIAEQLPSAVIEHIGSTAVSGMPAKPVVDLVVGVAVGQIGEASDELARYGFDLEGNIGPGMRGSAIRNALHAHSSYTSSSSADPSGTVECGSATSSVPTRANARSTWQ